MSYNHNLMTSSPLGVVWRYANGQKGVSDNVGIPKICATIGKLVNYDSSRKNRLSLRTSTLLVNGTARLYKEELDKLFQDCIRLNSQMLSRRSRDTSLADDNNSGSTSEENLTNCIRLNSQMLSRRSRDTSLADDNNSGSTSEENLTNCIRLNSQMLSRRSRDTSLADDNNSGSTSEENLTNCIELNSQMLSRRSRYTSLADDNNSGSTSEENLTNSKNENRNRSVRSRRFNRENNLERSHTSTKGSTRDSYGSSAMISPISDQSQISRKYTIEKADAETQTIKSYLANQREKEKYKRKQTIDFNSPRAVIMVYDEFINLPSKIINANINKNVKFL